MDEQKNLYDSLPDSMKRMVESLSKTWYKVGYSEALAHCVNALLESGKTIDEAQSILNLPQKEIENLKNNFMIQEKKAQ